MTDPAASARRFGNATVVATLIYGLAAVAVAVLAATDGGSLTRSVANLVVIVGFVAVLITWLAFSRSLQRLDGADAPRPNSGMWGFIAFIVLIGAASLISFYAGPGVTGRVVIPSLLRAAAAAALLTATLTLLRRPAGNR